MKEYAYPKLAQCGLGNMLFTWAQAVAYCQRTGARMVSPIWARVTRIGPWLRGERYKRYYGNEFTNVGYANRLTGWLMKFLGRVRVFRGMVGFFDPFIDDQEIVKRELIRIVNKKIVRAVDRLALEGPYVGVHVRRGDFACAGLLTPDAWYIKAIKCALEHPAAKGHKVVRVFTDGYPEEVSFIAKEFPMENVIVMPKASAIHDILALSRSDILVCSPRSTFSMWAVFLGQMPSIWDKDSEVPRLYRDSDRILNV